VKPRFVVWSQGGGRAGQTFWILDRAYNHREVDRYGPLRGWETDPVRLAAMAAVRCDRLNALEGQQ
jgi:hypothetical protein